MKFILDHIILVALAAVSGGALLWLTLAGRGRKATTLEVTQMINRGKTVLLDVRDAAEFAASHLRDAKHIPLAELATRMGELDKSKAKTIVVVCQTGARAAQAVSQLQKAGFEDALSLEGGQTAWLAAGLPVTK